MTEVLPSWRPGAARDALVGFLDVVVEVPVEDRVACLDNDGTLWCERPQYVQYLFFLEALEARAAEADVSKVPEFAALLASDAAAIGELGLERIALALTSLFEGSSPEDFRQRVRAFMSRARHPALGRPVRHTVYQPMLELIEELHRRSVAVAIVSGGGTEFVRAVSQEMYGVAPEAVVGTLIDYEYDRGADDVPRLRRSRRLDGAANEGPVKVRNIQRQLGRRPLLAAGNSGGDREMLEWASGGEGPTLALLIDHDDAQREFRYASRAGTFEESEPITEVAARSCWTVVSMAADWSTVFPPTATPL
jgi:hypothetical protein